MQQILMMNVEQLLRDFSAYRTFHKSDAVINMRIPHELLDRIKAIADARGVPYQSLISSILFALVSGDPQPGPGQSNNNIAPSAPLV
jgi:predicted DNA binding CopG/RHH family protein